MRSPKTLAALILALAALATATPTDAKEVKGVRQIEQQARATVVRGTPYKGQGTCTLGANFAPAFAIEYFLPPDDQYFTLLEPAQCVACPDTTKITAVHMTLFFQVLCEQPIEVSIVGVDRSDPSCAVPDPSNVIIGPVPYILDAPTINETIDFAMTLPETVCLTDSAFLLIEIDEFGAGCESSITMPLLIAGATGCALCKSWNFYDDGGSIVMDDLCEIFPPENVFGPPVHYVETDCTCEVVPTLPTSWGSLKIRYAKP